MEKVLCQIGVAPDFMRPASLPDNTLMFIHRRIADGDIYFVSNRSKRPEKFDARFRVKGKAPEVWRADSATIRRASYRIDGDHTVVPMTMAAEGSLFVVFRHGTTAANRSVADEPIRVIGDIDGAWDVGFQPGRRRTCVNHPGEPRLPERTPCTGHQVLLRYRDLQQDDRGTRSRT